MSMIFILIQIKFHIDINNDELLKTIWKHKGEKNKTKQKLIVTSNVVVCNNMKFKYNYCQT
jgi:hypothetical protein